MTAAARASVLGTGLRYLWYAFAVLVVLLAVVLGLIRVAAALAPEYRGMLEARIGEAIGQPVELGEIRIHWRGWNPAISLDDVVIGAGEHGGGLALGALDLRMDLNRSLRERRLQPAALELSGVDLTVQRDRDGRWLLVGAGAGGQREAALEALDRLMQQPIPVRLHDSRVTVLDLRRQQTRELDRVELRTSRLDGGGYQLAGRASLPEAWGRELAFVLAWGRDGPKPLEEDLVEAFVRVEGLRPGTLEDFFGDADGRVPATGSGDIQLWATLEGGIPGIRERPVPGVHGGRITLRAKDGALVFPDLFRWPLPFHALGVDGSWRLDDGGGWRLDVDEALADTDDGRIASSMRLSGAPDEALFIDLRANVRGMPGNVASTSRYLPSGIMPPRLVEWLDRSILEGTATAAEVIFSGHAPDFPFRDDEGRFEVRADVEDATLNYWPEWPALTGMRGELHFVGESMRITAQEGDIGGARLLEAEATIPVLGQTPLDIDGRFRAAGNEYLGFLRDMPPGGVGLREVLGALELSGEHDLDLALHIPFRGEPVAVDGRVHLDDAELRVPDWELALTGINGPVHFDRRGVTADRVQARYHDAPVLVSARTTGETLIELEALVQGVSVSALHERFPDTDFLAGATDVRVLARLPGFTGVQPSRYPAELRFQSDLQGVRSTLPAPLGKPADEVVPLEVGFGIDQRVGPVRVRYGDRAGLVIAAGAAGVERVGVRFGPGEATLPTDTGMEIMGRTPHLDLDGWRRWQARDRGEADRKTPDLRWLDLDMERLHLGGMDWADVSVFGRRDGEAWRLTVDGPAVAGNLEVPLEPGPGRLLRADLHHLRVAELPFDDEAEAGDTGMEAPSPDDGLSPADVPALEIRIADLQLLGRGFGRLELDAAHDQDGDYRLHTLTVDGADHSLNASGLWRRDEGTSTRFSLRSEDVGAALEGWGYEGAMRGGRGRGGGEFHWPGSPMAFNLAALDGELRMSLRNGHLVQVEPGAGRLLGLVSVAMLPRRLTLNFDDVFEQGFAFDRLEADFLIGDGVAEPRTLYLEGPAARISATGDVDLAGRTYDQVVSVTPRASSALPLLGGLVGGPPGAAAMFVAEQLFRAGVDDVARVEYRVTGPWDDPVIERRGRFEGETGNPTPGSGTPEP